MTIFFKELGNLFGNEDNLLPPQYNICRELGNVSGNEVSFSPSHSIQMMSL